MTVDIEHLLAHMTLEEKAALLAGADRWTSVPVERLGIPALKMTDGPAGARGARSWGGPTSACFPPGAALAATWNTALVRRVGAALGEEARAKGAHILLAPTVNIHRSPLAGRNFEAYSEDPYLAGKMATAYIQGLQSQGVGACIKHFVCNDSEFERMSISSEVSERALHEIYLTPFRIALRDAQPWAVMSAYNRLNGTYCSENALLLLDLLKGAWAFNGIVISDWFGTYSDKVAAGGLDLEMPGPARFMGGRVAGAVRSGALDAALVDDKVRRLLRTLERAGAFGDPGPKPEAAVDRPEHRRLARETAAEAMVLLKNADAILPLDLEALDSIAVIGAHARWPAVQGGGSIRVTPHYTVSPYAGIVARAGGQAAVRYALGCPASKGLPPLNVDWLTTDSGEKGLTMTYFDAPDMSGDPLCTEVVRQGTFKWVDDLAPGVNPMRFSLRMTATLTPPESGAYTFALESTGTSWLALDGRRVIEHQPGEAKELSVAEVELAAGQGYALEVAYAWDLGLAWQALNLRCMPPLPPDPIAAAADLAARSDVALVFAGLTDEWESEGFDRPDMDLPGEQVALIERVAAANPNTVVVLSAGSPVQMDWADKVKGVLLAWYPGQEAGNAIADVLFGDVDPSGRLPTTFPRRLQDNPAYINYPGENGKVYYGEGLFVGYRYYDKKGIEPLFPFGYGLSYTTFTYADLVLDAAEVAVGEGLRARVTVQNTGPRAGQEVVQLYVRDVSPRLTRPEKELKAFAKLALEPGEAQTVAFELDADALAFYDPARQAWAVEPGAFEVLVGHSSRDIRLRARFSVR
ncbi:MAG: glycoside hydrolase family 3 C-terminal domain-containing protein [Anaerolineae bacterium]|nr:glycoside hydrolase family 3 C-terminal domain-containing protein [Anaerolineae bacterium]